MFSQAICGIYLPQSLVDWPKSYMVVPFLLWACFRFGTYGALTSIALITAISVTGTMHGSMAFPAETPSRSLIYLQIYLGMLAAMTICVSAALCEVEALRTGLENKVRARTKGIEDLLKEREEFTTVVAHDLQSPLYGVRNALRATAEAFKGARLGVTELVSALDVMADTCTTLTERVADLLARKPRDELAAPDEPRPPLSVLLARIVSAHRLGIERKAARISLEGDMKIAISRPTEIEHILDILIDNAIKYSPAGSRIEVAAYRHGSSIEILVADNGQGIALPAAKKLFFRAPETPAVAGSLLAPGHGIGLYLASEQAAKLGGRLTYSSVQPTGARFRLVVPA
jgi:signal transduction histidine kinase